MNPLTAIPVAPESSPLNAGTGSDASPLAPHLASAPADEPARLPLQTMGQDDFLKLLITQLIHQDPLNPQKDTEFIAQMAQFTTLEQTKAMHGDLVKLREQQQGFEAFSLLGREVVVQNKDGLTLGAGTVTGFIRNGNDPQLIVGDQIYSLKDVVTIQSATPEPNS